MAKRDRNLDDEGTGTWTRCKEPAGEEEAGAWMERKQESGEEELG